MKLGLQVINFDRPGNPKNIGNKLGEIATTADEAGFYSLWVARVKTWCLTPVSSRSRKSSR
jgi:hypothetical protein